MTGVLRGSPENREIRAATDMVCRVAPDLCKADPWESRLSTGARMFSKTIEYALRAVVYLAVNSDEEHKVNISELSEAIDSPKSFTAKVLQSLTRDNVLISSHTGPTGGFYLSDAARQKSIWHVLQLLEADNVVSGCILGLKGCSEKNPCPLHHEYARIRPQLQTMFQAKTIHDLAREMDNPRVVIGNARRKRG